jgi:tetratricopeptide (TPR) repeat protein
MDIGQAMADAYLQAKRGDVDRADALCRQILTVVADHPGALHLLGMIAEARGDLDLALDYLRRAAAAEAPVFIDDDLVELLRRRGSPAEAAAAARRAVRKDETRTTAWHRLALVLIDAGELDEARRCLERAIALEPGSIDARNNLGIVLQRLGETLLARDQYRSALALDPSNAATHGNLAAVLGELGEYGDALACAQRAIELNPELVGPYVYAALAEANLRRPDAALPWLDRALSLAPQSVPVLVMRAEILRQLDRAEEGVILLREATALQPGNGEAYNALGLLFDAVEQGEQALSAFDRSIALLAQPAVAVANKAAVLLQLGRADEARVALDRALTLDPALALGWYTRADTKKFVADEPDIAAMEAALRDDPQRARRHSKRDADQHRLLLHYALGKAYLDTQEAERAFAHLDAGSRLKRATLSYDADATERRMASIAEAFPAALFARLKGSGEASGQPIFVLGMPRSGTTLVEQILASHPAVHGGGELRHLERLVREPGSAGDGPPPADELQALGRRYLAMTAPASGDALRVVDKMPSNFLYAGQIHLMLPRARIIHCRRDPVDTCFSCYSKLFTTGQEFSYDLVELGRYHRNYAALMAHWRSVLPRECFIEVDYEALVGDLDSEARRLIDFCGLPWDESCLRFHEGVRTIRSASMNQVRRPLYATSIGRWKPFSAQLGPLLEALGRR